MPFAGLGFRTHFLTMVVVGGESGEFGTYKETVARVGGTAYVGVGYRLGPGLLQLEAAFSIAPVLERVSGTSNVGALSFQLGYGLML